jgi:hypothetical protein
MFLLIYTSRINRMLLKTKQNTLSLYNLRISIVQKTVTVSGAQPTSNSMGSRASLIMSKAVGKKVEVKQSRYRPRQAQRVDRGIALSFRDLGARKWCVVSITSRPLYLRERPCNHCTGSWVGSGAGLDVCEKSRPHRDFFLIFISVTYMYIAGNTNKRVQRESIPAPACETPPQGCVFNSYD